jgi:uncharacterized protein YjaG (DUF416 family)
MQKFDESKLVSELERLPAPLRVAFAAACAERQMIGYRLFCAQTRQGDPEALQHALDDVWENPDPKRGVTTLEDQVEAIMNLIPREDGFAGSWTQQATNAQNAGMSVIYALRTRISGETQEAAWSARVAYEALDNFVINQKRIDMNEPGAEHQILCHSLVQAELARQRRDLDELLATERVQPREVITRLRTRARADAATFFGE